MSANADKLRRDAQKAMAKGDHGSALQAYQRLLKLDPTDSKLWVTVGDICAKLGQTQQAVQIYEKAAGQYALNWELVQAINLYNLIAKLEPGHSRATKQLKKLNSQLEIQRAAKRNADTVHRFYLEQAGSTPAGDGDPQAISLADSGDAGGSAAAGDDNWITYFSEGKGAGPAAAEGGGLPEWMEPTNIDDPKVATLTGELTQTILSQEAGAGGRQARLNERIDELPGYELFQGLSAKDFQPVVGHMELHKLRAGDVVMAPGDQGDSVYLVVRGEVELEAAGPEGSPLGLNRLGPGSFFGEERLFSGQPRHLGAATTGPTELVEVGRAGIDLLARKARPVHERLEAAHRRRMVAALVRCNPILSTLPEDKAKALLKRMEPRTEAAASVLIQRGEASSDLYFVVTGRVEAAAGGPTLLSLGPGESFGESGAAGGGPAPATFATAVPSRLLRLPAERVRQLLDQVPEVRQAVNELVAARKERLGA